MRKPGGSWPTDASSVAGGLDECNPSSPAADLAAQLRQYVQTHRSHPTNHFVPFHKDEIEHREASITISSS
jgi:hypothetical protein